MNIFFVIIKILVEKKCKDVRWYCFDVSKKMFDHICLTSYRKVNTLLVPILYLDQEECTIITVVFQV